MTSNKDNPKPKKPIYKLPSSTTLKDRALLGLFKGIGLEADWAQQRKVPGQDPSASLIEAAKALLLSAEHIGAAIRRSSAASNQFALYNLAYPRILLEELKVRGTAILKAKMADEKDEKMPVNRIIQAIAELQEELANLANPNGLKKESAGKSVASGVTKYFNRQSMTMTQHENYGSILYFHISLELNHMPTLFDRRAR